MRNCSCSSFRSETMVACWYRDSVITLFIWLFCNALPLTSQGLDACIVSSSFTVAQAEGLLTMICCHGAVRMCQVLVLSILANEATAFLTSPLGYVQINRLQSPQPFAHKPALLWTKKRTRTNGLQLRMEHIGRRYFLWRFAEWAFEKVMVFAQV